MMIQHFLQLFNSGSNGLPLPKLPGRIVFRFDAHSVSLEGQGANILQAGFQPAAMHLKHICLRRFR